MNFKKTLGLVLTAALVSTSLVAVKPVKAATPVVATAPTSINFKYFFPQRSLLVDGEADSYVVDTDYAGKVQYEFWVKSATDKDAKWQVVSADANGKPGYTAAVDGQNTPYAIPLVKGFTFKQGQYYTAVYVKAVGSEGKINYNHYMDATTGVDTQDAKTGTAQTCDAVKTGYFNAVSQSYKQKYKEMLDDFMFSQDSAVVGQTVTFKGFNSAPGAKFKLVVRKVGSDASTQTVVNPDAFKTSVDWSPKEAGTYQLIAWSAPDNAGKNADRDGWAISSKYFTVTKEAPVTKPAVDASTIKLSAGMLPGQTMVKLQLTGVDDPSTCTVKFGDKVFKYDATQKLFYANVESADQALLAKADTYTVTVTAAPVTKAAVDASTIKLSAGMLPGQTMVKLQLAGDVDPSAYTVKFGDKVFKYDATQKLFYANVESADSTLLAKADTYTVAAK